MGSKVPDKVEQIITMFKRYVVGAGDDKQEYERRKGFVAGFFYCTRRDNQLTKKYFEKKFEAEDIENFNIGFSMIDREMWDVCRSYDPKFNAVSTEL